MARELQLEKGLLVKELSSRRKQDRQSYLVCVSEVRGVWCVPETE
jgi:hypothetical protein